MRGIFIYRYYIIYARFCHPLLFLRAHSYVKFNVYVKNNICFYVEYSQSNFEKCC